MPIKRPARTTDQGGRFRFTLLGIVLLSLAGCAGHQSDTMLPPAGLIQFPAMTASQPAEVIIEQTAPAEPGSVLLAAVEEKTADDIFDPFAKPGEEGVEEYDPWEPFNMQMFEFNRQVDRWVLKPVAKGYNFVVPNPVQIGVSNFFYNLRFPPRFFNNVFQGKMKGAGIEVGRFLVNSTVGIGGLMDVAQHLDLKTPEEDGGQTLGFYGVKPGPYLVIPLLQPFTVRDLVGYIADIFLNPINWLVAPLIEVKNVPSLIPHTSRTTNTVVQVGSRVFQIVNERSLNLEKFQGVEEATLDLYTAVRNAYLQGRAKAIQE